MNKKDIFVPSPVYQEQEVWYVDQEERFVYKANLVKTELFLDDEENNVYLTLFLPEENRHVHAYLEENVVFSTEKKAKKEMKKILNGKKSAKTDLELKEFVPELVADKFDKVVVETESGSYIGFVEMIIVIFDYLGAEYRISYLVSDNFFGKMKREMNVKKV